VCPAKRGALGGVITGRAGAIWGWVRPVPWPPIPAPYADPARRVYEVARGWGGVSVMVAFQSRFAELPLAPYFGLGECFDDV
jgi:hypothetical protein